MAVALENNFVSSRNACKLCTPLGAALVFKGIENSIALLHGSQGCATYIRRYLISHFREPVDIASSNFSEESAVFGGGKNLLTALRNIAAQYHPSLIGIATTCLSETIGEDVPGLLRDIPEHELEGRPVLAHVSTPSYRGTHAEGFRDAVRAVVERLAVDSDRESFPKQINIFPGICSPEDLRYLREIVSAFGLHGVMLPDYSETLDGPAWSEYHLLPPGGTPLKDIASMGHSRASLGLGRAVNTALGKSAGEFLRERFGVDYRAMGLPIGIRETDAFMEVLAELSGKKVPEKFARERGRLVDAMIDGHKYIFGKKALVYGEEDLVLGTAMFFAEIGVVPILCVSGGKSGNLRRIFESLLPEFAGKVEVADGKDFAAVAEMAQSLRPDIVIGSSKGFSISRNLAVPLIRVGFPIHDRIGGQRVLHYGYRGALAFYDQIVNAFLDEKQNKSVVGYSYL